MASLARIPFSSSDEALIRTLNGWMLFLIIIHVVGALFFATCGCFGMFGGFAAFAVSAIGGILTTIQMLLVIVLGIVMGAEGFAVMQARTALNNVVATDSADQQQLSTAFAKLKFFFLLELIWFAVNIIFAFLQLLMALLAPEMAGSGFGDMGGMGGGSTYDPYGGGGYQPQPYDPYGGGS